MGNRSSTSERLHLALALALVVGAGTPAGAGWFIRGDVDGSGALNITDPVQLLGYLFLGEEAAVQCQDAADLDDDGKLDVTDAIHLLTHLFLGGPPPKTPIRGCWLDPTEDQLGCAMSEACGSVGVFFVCQKSGSFVQSLVEAKREILNAIASLSPEDQFGIAFFDASLYRFPANGSPVSATPEMKAAAVAMVNQTFAGSGTCNLPALIAGLQVAAQSSAKSKQLHYLANGFTTCPGKDAVTYQAEILAELQARNVNQVPINAICIGTPGGVDEAFMKKIAGDNGGSFVRIIYP